MTEFALSTWSVDGLLSTGFPLLELPVTLRDHDLALLEICHFHLPSTEPADLNALRARLAKANVRLFSLLIDTGDLASSDPNVLGDSVKTIRRYIGVAARLGAERVRISAGQQPATPQTLAQSAGHLADLANYASEQGLGASTENWQQTALEAESLLWLLEHTSTPLGLCVDTGNAEATADKYRTLERLLPHATSVHLKARRDGGGGIDHADLECCGALMRAARFRGPITLIYDGKQDEWAEIAALHRAAQADLGLARA